MFEGYARYRKLIGRGVAVLCPDGLVRKYKIAGVRINCDASGERIDGIELDMPGWMSSQFYVDGINVVKDGCHLWLNPSLLHRNKGDCARAHARSQLEHVEMKIRNAEERLRQMGKDRDDVARELERLEKSRGDLTGSYGKEKWFSEKHGQGGD